MDKKIITKKQMFSKAYIVKNLAEDIAYNLHVGLRKYCDDPHSGTAWRAIAEFEDDNWVQLCQLVAEQSYKELRRAFKEQFNESNK